jgi:glycerol uptake facilitator-like aquaporin
MNYRAIVGEFFGAAVLVATIVGSGIMATALSDDSLVRLLVNSLSTIFVLGVLILTLGPVSGAHLNPAVTLALAVSKKFPSNQVLPYMVAQIAGGVTGALVSNTMFGLSTLQISTTERFQLGTGIGEVIATLLLVFVILALVKTKRSDLIAIGAPAVVGAAFFFTSSTSFANPAVSVGRIFSDTLTGIAPGSAAGYVLVQIVGALLAVGLVQQLFPKAKKGKSKKN